MHFPLRELSVDPAFRKRMLRSAALLLAILLPMGGFMGWYGFNQVTDLLTARATWEQGTEAAGGDIDGNTTTRKFLLHSLEGTVNYLTKEGVRQAAQVDVTSAFEDFDTSLPLVIRYEPAHPERVAISWVQSLAYGVWLWAALVWALSLFMIGSAGVTLRTTWRGLRAATLCSTGARALALRVHSSGPQIVNGRPTGAHEVKYSLPGASEVRTALLHRPALVVEHGGQTLGLALHPPHLEDHPVILGEGLYPFVVNEAQHQAVVAALRQHGPGEVGPG